MGLVFLFSCSDSGSARVSTDIISFNQQPPLAGKNTNSEKSDSLEIVSLLKDVYKWHDQNQKELPDFDVVSKDSFQVGLNYNSFNKTFDAIKKTNYFSAAFLNNYKRLGDCINKKLANANPKYLNEINFPYQESDSWTYFQDDAPEFWNKFTINDFKLTSDTASLKWQIHGEGWSSDKYPVKFVKADGKWKVSYMEGFDVNKYYQ